MTFPNLNGQKQALIGAPGVITMSSVLNTHAHELFCNWQDFVRITVHAVV